MSEDKARSGGSLEPIIIKKYANRRLYNTDTSAYVTLENLSDMVRSGVDFVVQDARSGEDITRFVLGQIIFEQENRGQNLLPVQFLRRLIRFYGDSMQGMLPAYLEMSMETFAKSRERLREQFELAWGGRTPIAAFEEQARQNMALFEQAMRLWTPFGLSGGRGESGETPPSPPTAAETETLAEMRKQLSEMQRQLDSLVQARKPEGR